MKFRKRIGNFSLDGDLDPDEITKQLGIAPDWVARKGEYTFEGAQYPIKGSIWVVYCALDDGCDVQAQIGSLLFKLSGKLDLAGELSAKYNGTFDLVGCRGSKNGFWIEAANVRRLADLNIDIECEYVDAENVICEELEDAD
jgi:hypothetical protein